VLKKQLPSTEKETGEEDKVALLITSIEGHEEPEAAMEEDSSCEDKAPSSVDEAVEFAGRNSKSSSDFIKVLDKMGYAIQPKSGRVVNHNERMSAYRKAKSKVQE